MHFFSKSLVRNTNSSGNSKPPRVESREPKEGGRKMYASPCTHNQGNNRGSDHLVVKSAYGGSIHICARVSKCDKTIDKPLIKHH